MPRISIAAAGSVLASLFMLLGCGKRESQQNEASSLQPISDVTFSDREQALYDRAIEAQQALGAQLKGQLMQAIMQGGPASAISVCGEEAPRIAAEVSQEYGLRIGRTSHKQRSPENTPPAWATDEVARRAGTPVVARSEAGLKLLLPIRAEGTCLLCHGDKSQMPEPLVQALDEHYPADAATGFSEGDLRGWFWIECEATSETQASETGEGEA